MAEMKVTSIEQLIKYSEGQIVELPPFAEGQRFVARIKRPSMMGLIKTGKIPNSLLKTANSLFLKGGVSSEGDDKVLDNLFDVLDVLCEATFVEPKYSDLKEAGISLTDDQYMFIFNYTQEGVKSLEKFRKVKANN